MNSLPLHEMSFDNPGDFTDAFPSQREKQLPPRFGGLVTPTPPCQHKDAPFAQLASCTASIQQQQQAPPVQQGGSASVDVVPEDMAELQRLLAMYNNDLDKVQEHLTRESLRLKQSGQQQKEAQHQLSDPDQVQPQNDFSFPSVFEGVSHGFQTKGNKDGPFSLSMLSSIPQTTPLLPPANVISSSAQIFGDSEGKAEPPVLSTLRKTSKRSRSSSSQEKLQAILHMQNAGGDFPDEDGFYPIHRACRDFPDNARLIGTMLCTNPNVGRLRVKAPKQPPNFGFVSSCIAQKPEKRSKNILGLASSVTSFDRSFPIHVALASNAPLDVIKILVRSCPEILSRGDGSEAVPLSVALRHGAPVNVLNLLLSTNPGAASTTDARMNTSLHHACAPRSHGSKKLGVCPLSFLKTLVAANPGAVHARNFNGKTPLDLAQSAGTFDDETISFLQDMAYEEDEVEEAPDA